MSTPIPAPGTPGVKDDPTKPWKALVAAFVAGLLVALRDYFVGADAINVQGLLVALGTFIVTFLVTYLTRNPKVVTTDTSRIR